MRHAEFINLFITFRNQYFINLFVAVYELFLAI